MVRIIEEIETKFGNMRHGGRVGNRAVYVTVGITLEGAKDVLGMWTGASEARSSGWAC